MSLSLWRKYAQNDTKTVTARTTKLQQTRRQFSGPRRVLTILINCSPSAQPTAAKLSRRSQNPQRAACCAEVVDRGKFFQPGASNQPTPAVVELLPVKGSQEGDPPNAAKGSKNMGRPVRRPPRATRSGRRKTPLCSRVATGLRGMGGGLPLRTGVGAGIRWWAAYSCVSSL